MDTSSSTSREEQPVQVETYMDNDLYKAAVDGNIKAFNDYQGRLDCLVSRNKNKLLNLCPSLKFKANVKGETPLHIEAKYGHLTIVRLLLQDVKANEDLENGIEPAKQMLIATDDEENMALHIAARYGHLETAQELIQKDPDFAYPANKSGEYPLFIAARRGNYLLVTEILDNCSYVALGGPDGATALHAAVMANCKKTTKVILVKTSNLAKEADQNGRTPLHYAAHLGHHSIVKQLLKYDKSAAYIKDKEEMTPLLMAARQGYAHIMKAIINHCSDCCELVDQRRWNFLHFASVSLPFKPLSEFLTAQEFRHFIDDKDINGNTPLHILANTRYYTGIKAESFTHDKVGLGIMDLRWNATSRRKDEIFKLLEDICREEVGGVPVRPMHKYKGDLSHMDKTRENHSVVAALIATVTFAAAFTLPGGYQSEEGGDQGTAILLREAAFIVFMITDAIAMVSSLSALAIYFIWSSQPFAVKELGSYILAYRLIGIAMGALVIAFVTGTYTVLRPSKGLAIAICFIGLSFFPLVIKWIQDKILVWISLS
ncbi:hypothetical protein CCACVL1_01916 [Corchorus capsularis]|uniref:PGG domain-containing protein n=1 Tax=Corchorus capsularis TaxID=210143 RepID=A0A1R3KEA4_COCAP|nr:hypothetical protein CCACVL1_01916 [Corchorus capsularis]